jgi:serine protease AprX
MRSIVLAAAVGALLMAAVSAQARPDASPPKPPPPAGPQAPLKADRDGDKVFDDLEARLAGLPDDAPVAVIVRTALPAKAERLRSLADRVGAFRVARAFASLNGLAATVTKRQALALARLPDVVHIEENSTVRAANDTAQASFGVAQARVDAGVDGDGDGDPEAYSATDLVAAVVDTGIDASHLDLDEGKVLAFEDLVNGRAEPYDDNGHGTHVAATIAGEGDALADRRYRGVAPGAGLVGIKVLDASGNGTLADVAAAIDWVILNKDVYGIEAVNLSLAAAGCSDGTDTASLAVNRAHEAGLVVVVAAGNAGPGTCTIGSPGAAAGALTVGAMADLGERGFRQAWFSSRGPTADGRVKPDVSAPGVAVTSAAAGTGGGYRALNGTSMATPFVTGVALLLREAAPGLSPGDVKDVLAATAVDWGAAGPDPEYGHGRLDVHAALGAATGANLGSPPPVPAHVVFEGSLDAAGDAAEYPLEVADPSFPVAATLVIPGVSRGSASSPDFDLRLFDPAGREVAVALTSSRQEDLGLQSPASGTYRLRVESYAGAGAFVVDVSAGLADGEGDTTPPAAPGGLVAAAGDRSVGLDWNDNADSDLAGYRVERRDPAGAWIQLAETQASAYADAGLANGTAYAYRVTAFDTSGNESAPSAEAAATPHAPILTSYRPTSFVVVAGRRSAGSLGSLYTSNGVRLDVASKKVGAAHVAELEVRTTVAAPDRAAASLAIDFDGHATGASTVLTVAVLDWSSGTWQVVGGPWTGATSDRVVTWSAAPAAGYLSPSGEIRLQVRGTRPTSFTARTDWVRFTLGR